MYKVLIFDIKSSKKIENRTSFQHKLLKIIKQCNKIFKDYIISDFKITTGDEWEGLLSITAPEERIINFFYENLHSLVEFYVGIGHGNISVYDLTLPVNELDGTAFHAARNSLNKAKFTNKVYKLVN